MVLVYFLPSPSEAQIYDKVLRLHVLANSDSPKDQSLKLMVRDEILEYSKTLGEFEGVESAEETYSHELEKIKEQCLNIL
jgi:stage II sporulation protein R